MQLDDPACWDRLLAARHGTLGTVNPARGVDVVPVVFVVVDEQVVMPIDTVKPKSGPTLQRLRNLLVDPRAVLLIDRYHDDWSRLWWVRVHGEAKQQVPTTVQLESLGRAFPAYRRADAVTSVIVLAPSEVTGWSATPAAT